MGRWATIAGVVLSCSLGAVWLFAAIAKMVDIVVGSGGGTWADQFSPLLTGVVLFAELSIGVALVSGQRVKPHVGAIALLSLFVVALVLYPIAPAQSCGCAGSAGAALGIDTFDPLARIAVLVSMHLLAMALLAPNGRSWKEAGGLPVQDHAARSISSGPSS